MKSEQIKVRMKTASLFFLFLFQCFIGYSQTKSIRTSDGIDIYVIIKGKGTPCLYLHGGPGSGSYWFEKFMGDFLEQHFQMIYIDQRGVGRSSSPKDKNYSMERMAKDFEEVREALGIKQWLTLGHSFGGVLQMGYIERYPKSVIGMLMINCTLNLKKSLCRSWLPKAYEFMGAEDPAPCPDDSIFILKKGLFAAAGKLNEKGLMWKMAFASPENQTILDATYKDIPDFNNDFSQAAMSLDDYWKDYFGNTKDIKVPVLFFYGKTDWMVGPEHYKSIRFPEMILWASDVGHMPFLENKTDLEKAIKNYIEKYKF